MDKGKRKKLESAGFKVGTVQEFLGLSDEEAAMVDLKARLIQLLKRSRKSRLITQDELAKLMKSSQSRVAKMEALAFDVSLDLICKALFSMGISRKEIARSIASKQAA
jgi:predicted transcriptional regulator